MEKKKPIRKCVACREHKEKTELIRLVVSEDADVRIDERQKANGRGCYVCKTETCIAKAVKSGAIDRQLKVQSKPELKEQLLEAIKDNE